MLCELLCHVATLRETVTAECCKMCSALGHYWSLLVLWTVWARTFLISGFSKPPKRKSLVKGQKKANKTIYGVAVSPII